MYQVSRTIKHDDGRVFEAGANDLAFATPDEIAGWLSIGWVTPYTPEPEPLSEPGPVAMPHWEGEGDAPPGYWEHVPPQVDEPAENSDAPRSRRRKTEE